MEFLSRRIATTRGAHNSLRLLLIFLIVTLIPAWGQNPIVVENQNLVGGNPSTGTVTLSGTAPPTGMTVQLSSNRTTVATVPSSVTVAAGATAATFPVTTNRVRSTTNATISGTSAGVTKSAVLTVTR
jgi:hypothetical protein